MAYDPQRLFANLTEKERLFGHHSAEGRAIRTLSRALQGWSTESLSARDMLVMCDQAIEDWLKARLNVSAWSATGVGRLLALAQAEKLLTAEESAWLRRLHDLRVGSALPAADEVAAALAAALEVIERRWS
jgi:hypothetical protein